MAAKCDLHDIHHEEIQELKRSSIQPWIRSVFITVMLGLIGYSVSFVGYSIITFATKAEVKEAKVDLKQDLEEIKELIKAGR